MRQCAYFVHVVLSVVTGRVLNAQCMECAASALGRCSHVGALLEFMLQHVKEHGYEGMYQELVLLCVYQSCTSFVPYSPGYSAQPNFGCSQKLRIMRITQR